MTGINDTDKKLVEKIRSGDSAAFESVYKRYWLYFYRLASKISEDEIIAEDIIQETFISLWEKGCHQEITNLEAYLYQTVKFRCFMHLRSGAISKKHIQRFTTLTTARVIEDEYDYKELEQALQQGIAGLPERCKEVFELSRMESLPNKKIAEQLKISPKTVENQITKALKHLKLSVDKLAILLTLLSF